MNLGSPGCRTLEFSPRNDGAGSQGTAKQPRRAGSQRRLVRWERLCRGPTGIRRTCEGGTSPSGGRACTRSFARGLLAALLIPFGLSAVDAADANRLRSLAGVDPYYPGLATARLTTPQWIGEDGVEAVVVLAIDDMRGHERWEAYLRPILERLKQIDGRAALSIMTCQIDPAEPHLQRWLDEGVSLEAHTQDHPCPLLAESDFARAKATYDRCIDQMAQVPGNRPVAFRMPCCDSLNTPSPRFYSEIFASRTEAGRFLEADSSVFVLLTPDDPALPRELVWRGDGTERFRRYVPFPAFSNTIENYPYPYVIGTGCWEFPCIAPSDWSAQHVQRPANPETVADWKAALDAVVEKQGVFALVFHPYEWIRPEQIVELIDHAVSRHGSRVKFLNFREAVDRLSASALGGERLRAAEGGDNGIRVLDLNDDVWQDVVVGRGEHRRTRWWRPDERRWVETSFPCPIVSSVPAGGQAALSSGAVFGVFRPGAGASVLIRNDEQAGAWTFTEGQWLAEPALLQGLELDAEPLFTQRAGVDRGVRLADLDDDGRCELIVANDRQRAVFRWQPAPGAADAPGGPGHWKACPWRLPEGAQFVDAGGNDRGLRLVDVDEDGPLDLLWSHEGGSGVVLWRGMESGFSQTVLARQVGEPGCLPLLVRGRTNNGAWFHDRHLVVQNEDTARLPNLVDRRSFNELLGEADLGARTPRAALAGLKARPGFRVELVASEPLVADPVGFDWDDRGRLWVVEMADYPMGIDGAGQVGGRVRVLSDRDGDGRYDHADLLCDELPYPTGITTWRDGCLVTAAPDILFLADRDGDGRAEVRQALYRGLSEGNQQHRANGFTRGLDNWLYCGNGHSGGRLVGPAGEPPVNISGRDFRIHPSSGRVDTLLGVTQFQRARSDWGHWFGNNNIEPLFQYLIEDRYLRRNPHVAPGNVVALVPDLPGTAPVFPRSRTLARFNDFHTANRFTSACGSILYRDELLGAHLAGNSFVSEPVHNLVHREVVRSDGLRYESHRAADEASSEFLASSDSWFRPTFLATGPDGALWIADMVRAVIEHPEWIPDETEAMLDVRAGSQQGRIYRVLPVGTEPRPIPHLADWTTEERVAGLESPNGWVRDKIQELLVEQGSGEPVAALERMAREGQRATARLHALATLEGLDHLDTATLLAALADPHPGVRRQALELAEPRLRRGEAANDEVLATVCRLGDDREPQVRLQLALALGESRSQAAGQLLADLARAPSEGELDELLVTAIHSSLVPHAATMARHWRRSPGPRGPAPAVLAAVIEVAIATDDLAATEALVQLLETPLADGGGAGSPAAIEPTWQADGVARLVEALERRSKSLAELGQRLPSGVAGLERLTARLLAGAQATLADDQQPAEARLAAIELLGKLAAGEAATADRLLPLIDGRQPPELQQAALAVLSRSDQEKVSIGLLERWSSLNPTLRSEVLDLLLRRDTWIDQCLTQLEQGSVAANQIDAAHRQRLLAHRRGDVRQRAAALWADEGKHTRADVVAAHRQVAEMTGDAERGVQWFDQRCGVCHRLGERGVAVGPDLSPQAAKPALALLEAILDPNRAVEAPYLNYVVVTTDGLAYSGLIVAETSTAITLRGQQGKDQVLLRSQIDSMESTGKSLMPEGLERDLTDQQMADLLCFIRQAAPRPKQFALGQAELVRPDGLRGELSCLSTNCQIFGSTLVLEDENRNLGYWTSADDHALWTIEVPHGGDFEVLLEWACDDATAGNTLLLEIGEARLTHRVEGTGGWNEYQRTSIGQMTIAEGTHQVTVRATGPLSGCLLDFKSITLRPRRRRG